MAESNNSELSNLRVLSTTMAWKVVPVKLGFSVIVSTKLKFPIPITLVTTRVALELKLPSLSTALIKYVPFLAGTVTEVAGLAIFWTNET